MVVWIQRMSVEPSLRAFAARAFSRSIGRYRGARALAGRLGWIPPDERVRWFGARTVGEGARALTARVARGISTPGAWTLMVGADGDLQRALAQKFDGLGWSYRRVATLRDLDRGTLDGPPPSAVLATDVEARPVTEAARQALAEPRLSDLPLEYVTGLEPEHRQFRRQDEYAEDIFISPVLLAQPSPYELYDASLERFEQKCGLRDYLDLYQLLTDVDQRGVAGDVAEFGSYKGHSGWLIGKTLEALGSSKRLHMFDTFESFPEERGVDHFWSGTHEVRLEEVQSRLADLPAVRLVQGEFQKTLPAAGLEEIALAYVDCDSYRAVSYLAPELFERHLSPGGVIVFEDYGHPALLGCRVAVHEYFDGRVDCLRFFSQFSGLYIVVKLSTSDTQTTAGSAAA
jgi:O-methyltransferase